MPVETRAQWLLVKQAEALAEIARHLSGTIEFATEPAAGVSSEEVAWESSKATKKPRAAEGTIDISSGVAEEGRPANKRIHGRTRRF